MEEVSPSEINAGMSVHHAPVTPSVALTRNIGTPSNVRSLKASGAQQKHGNSGGEEKTEFAGARNPLFFRMHGGSRCIFCLPHYVPTWQPACDHTMTGRRPGTMH